MSRFLSRCDSKCSRCDISVTSVTAEHYLFKCPKPRLFGTFLRLITMRHIFLLILLMAVCKGCNKALKNDHGVKRHRISCKPAKELTANLFQKRQELQRSSRRFSLNADKPQAVPEVVSINLSRDGRRLTSW